MGKYNQVCYHLLLPSSHITCNINKTTRSHRESVSPVYLTWWLNVLINGLSAGSSAVLLQCVVRPDGTDGNTLLQYCSPTRTRTRTIQPPIKLSPTLGESRSQRRPPRQRTNPVPVHHQTRRQHRTLCPDEEQEDAQEDTQEDAQEDMLEESGDPTWTPHEGG